ncbi:hypothetical protein ACFFGH_34215 [Lysobacter korlensis]|uniref:Uncharacterized protein n=1 Tax=Lysobacter korlensis TaxID=553636 RepID=A0ABV6S106_9GAMM
MSRAFQAFGTQPSSLAAPDTFVAELRRFFTAEQLATCAVEVEEHPVDESRHVVLLTWDGRWWARFSPQTGQEVRADATQAASLAASQRDRDKVVRSDYRIHVLFADDPDKRYTNHAVQLLDFLEDAAAMVIFDPERQDFL